MGWETRNNRSSLYLKSRNLDGTVTSTYISRGSPLFPAFQLLAEMRHERLVERAARGTRLRQSQTDLACLAHLVDAQIARANAVRDAHLQAAGFHRHKERILTELSSSPIRRTLNPTQITRMTSLQKPRMTRICNHEFATTNFTNDTNL